MGNSECYLRIEAVNLGNSVYDTEDLSTIRGSGLMIVSLQGEISPILTKYCTLTQQEPVTQGASQILFRVQADKGLNSKQLVAKVSEELRKHPQLQYATLVVDSVEDEFDLARESLLASNRFRQMHSLRVSPADICATEKSLAPERSDQEARPWCAIDRVRPGVEKPERLRNPEKSWVSHSVLARREYGFNKKQNFYRTLKAVEWNPQLPVSLRPRFAWDFQQIAAFDSDMRKAADEGLVPKNLSGKLAVLYVDGNKFGSKQKSYCIEERRQSEFDQAVQGNWRAAIKQILESAWSPEHGMNPLWWNTAETSEARLRLETLLWGGDEVIWVVPAWFGLSIT